MLGSKGGRTAHAGIDDCIVSCGQPRDFRMQSRSREFIDLPASAAYTQAIGEIAIFAPSGTVDVSSDRAHHRKGRWPNSEKAIVIYDSKD